MPPLLASQDGEGKGHLLGNNDNGNRNNNGGSIDSSGPIDVVEYSSATTIPTTNNNAIALLEKYDSTNNNVNRKERFKSSSVKVERKTNAEMKSQLSLRKGEDSTTYETIVREEVSLGQGYQQHQDNSNVQKNTNISITDAKAERTTIKQYSKYHNSQSATSRATTSQRNDRPKTMKHTSSEKIFTKAPTPPLKFKEKGVINLSYSTISSKTIKCANGTTGRQYTRRTTFVRNSEKYVIVETVLIDSKGNRESFCNGGEAGSGLDGERISSRRRKRMGEGKSGILTSSLLAGDVIKGLVCNSLNSATSCSATTRRDSRSGDDEGGGGKEQEKRSNPCVIVDADDDDVLANSNPWLGRFCCGVTA